MIKKLVIAVGILAVVFVVAVAVVAILIDPIVRKGVEYGSTSALKVPTHLAGASVKYKGKVELDRFEVGNPAGFTEPKALLLEHLDLEVHPRELFKPVVHIEQLRIVKPEVALEFVGTKSNLSVLMDNLPKSEPAAEKPDKKGGEKRFLIQKLRIDNGTVKFRSDSLPGGTKTMALPPIELENVGTAEGGATTAQILRVVLQSLGTAALNAGEGLLPKELLNGLRGDLSKQMQSVPDEIRRKLGELKAPEAAEPEKVEKTLKDLFEKKAH
jgi:hypothetical protein